MATKRTGSTAAKGAPGVTGRRAGHEAHAEGGDCRCKEVSKKSPRGLMKMMFSDLAFWRKR